MKLYLVSVAGKNLSKNSVFQNFIFQLMRGDGICNKNYLNLLLGESPQVKKLTLTISIDINPQFMGFFDTSSIKFVRKEKDSRGVECLYFEIANGAKIGITTPDLFSLDLYINDFDEPAYRIDIPQNYFTNFMGFFPNDFAVGVNNV